MKKNGFIKKYFIVLGCILAAMAVFFIVFWNYLLDYQQHLPTVLCEKVLTAYQNGDYEFLQNNCKALPEVLQDSSILGQYLEQGFEKSDLYYYEGSTDTKSGAITYFFQANDKRVAEVTVVPTSEKSRFGFSIYEISSMEQKEFGEITFVESAGSRILMHGEPIDELYRTEQTPVDAGFELINGEPLLDTIYILPDYYGLLEITAEDFHGEACVITWDEERESYITSLTITEQLEKEISEFAVAAAKEYAVFATVKNVSSAALCTYLYPGTEFYQAIKTYRNNWGVPKTADEFQNINVTDCHQYSQTDFSCKVTFDYVVSQDALQRTFPISLQCYITSKNGKYQIVDMVTN